MPDDDDELVDHEAEDAPTEDDALDKLRGAAVGTEDPNIVGDAGPTDIPPGTDGGTTPLVTTDEPVDHLEV